jgi:hypothetical protein
MFISKILLNKRKEKKRKEKKFTRALRTSKWIIVILFIGVCAGKVWEK